MTNTACRRVLIADPPYRHLDAGRSWLHRGKWPCSWIACAGAAPCVMAFRRRLVLSETLESRIHVAADEQYDLFLDGVRVGRGSERRAPNCWFFDSYELKLGPGAHVLVARVWAPGAAAPRSSMSLRPGFLLSPDDESLVPLLGTGTSPWDGKLLQGYAFSPPFAHPYYSIGHNVTVDAGLMGEECRAGGGVGWGPVLTLHPGSDATERTRVGGEHLLVPALLPEPRSVAWRSGVVRHASRGGGDQDFSEQTHSSELAEAWEGLWKSGHRLAFPPGTTARVLMDLQDYVCAYSEMAATGGRNSRIRVYWAESLFYSNAAPENGGDMLEAHEKPKGNRSEIQGKRFFGVGETFLPDGQGGRIFDGPFWRAGRYVCVSIETSDEPLAIESFALRDTRYPLDISGEVGCDDPRLPPLIEKAVRTFAVSSQDAWVDPFYEQMMWAGDGIQCMLVGMVLSRDDRLAAKWLRMLWASRLPSGLSCARYPARDNLLIAPYALYWVLGLKEYAWWRDDLASVREFMPAAREVLMAFERYLDSDGVLERLPGWNFVDWVQGWETGIPPGADRGKSSILNWHYVLALISMAELEEALGERELADRNRRLAGHCARGAIHAFWNEDTGLFADDCSRLHYSEHAQCFALLSGVLTPTMSKRVANALLTAPGLKRTTFGFSHHLFEVLGKIGRTDRLLERLQPWFDLDDHGLLTLPEAPEPSRSDCHAWSTHPLYHLVATILGLRPDALGFQRVILRPQLASINKMKVLIPHPQGRVAVCMERYASNAIRGQVELPDDVSGRLVFGDVEMPLYGKADFDLPV